MATDDQDPVIAQIQLGILLRDLRKQAKVSLVEAGKHITTSHVSVSRIEKGQQPITVDDVDALLTMYEAGDKDSAEALRLANTRKSRNRRRRDSPYRDVIPNSFRRYLAMEAEASDILKYDELLVTGLFQTEDYARTLMEAHSPLAGRREIDLQIEARRTRQLILDRSEPAPPRLEVILHEAALHRVIGGDAVMHGQLRRILELSERPNIQVRILPFRPAPTPNKNEAFSAQTGFYLLKLPERGTILYMEDFAGSTYPEDVKLIQQYAMAFERLLSASTDPAGSRDLIAKVAKHYQ